MPKSSKVIKKSTSDRARRRKKTVSSISSLGFIASKPCFRCIERNLDCIVLQDGHCSECVSATMDKLCDSESSGPIRSVVELNKKKNEMDKELKVLAAASAKVARLSKQIKLLESKSRDEISRMIKELDEEESSDEASKLTADQNIDTSWLDQFQEDPSFIELLQGFVGETS